MTITKVLAVACLALAGGALAEHVRADEIFICEDGRQLRAGVADIERLKQTEPCVASHFGISLPASRLASSMDPSADVIPPRNPRRTALRPSAQNVGLGRTDGEVNLSNVVILNAGQFD